MKYIMAPEPEDQPMRMVSFTKKWRTIAYGICAYQTKSRFRNPPPILKINIALTMLMVPIPKLFGIRPPSISRGLASLRFTHTSPFIHNLRGSVQLQQQRTTSTHYPSNFSRRFIIVPGMSFVDV